MNAVAQKRSGQEEINVNLTRLDARVGVLESGLSTLGVKIDSLSNVFSASRQTNWPLFLTGLSMFCTLAVGVWYFIEIKVKLNSAETLSPMLVQSAISTKERDELRNEAVGIRETLAVLREKEAAGVERAKEIEGQFKKLGDDFNLSAAHQHRMNSIYWNSSPLGRICPYPDGPFFFPSFSQHLPNQ